MIGYGLGVSGIRIGDRRAITFSIKRDYETAIMYCREREISCLTDLLRSEQKLSPEMRQFIADVLEGKPLFIFYSPIQRRKPNYRRDIEIALAVHQAYKKIPRLRSSREGIGATTEIANKFSLTEDDVWKIYSRANKDLDLEETATRGAICFRD